MLHLATPHPWLYFAIGNVLTLYKCSISFFPYFALSHLAYCHCEESYLCLFSSIKLKLHRMLSCSYLKVLII